MRKPIGWSDEKILSLYLGLGAGLAISPGFRMMLDKLGVGEWVITLLGITIVLVIGPLLRKSQLSSSDSPSGPGSAELK